MEHRIPATLNADQSVHVCTTIERECAIAAGLGVATDDLLAFTRNALLASCLSAGRRTALSARRRACETEK